MATPAQIRDPPDAIDANAELQARTAAFSQAILDASASGWASDRVARVAAFYTDDTIVFPPRGEPIRGMAAITRYWTRTPDRQIIAHSAIAERIDVAGDLATEIGQLRVTIRLGTEPPAESTSTYISIWRRSAGVWRKQMDTWW